MKIGIPRALLYYHYLPFWITLFEELGHEVVLSTKTTKNIVNLGVEMCVDDACLPIKIFHGHVSDLRDKSDCVFIPRFTSISPGEFICPKFIGLPEMIRNSVPQLPPLWVVDYNMHRRMKDKYKGMVKHCRELGIPVKTIKGALTAAEIHQNHYHEQLLKGGNPLEILEGKIPANEQGETHGTIGLLGHPYLLYDEFASMGIVKKLMQRGYKVMVPENVPDSEINRQCSRMPKRLFWTYGRHLLGSGLYMMTPGKVDGIIFMSSFGCGIDAFIGELLQRFNQREQKLPYITMTVDEHSGHAGFDTRLEAFLDMIQWRDEYGNHFSAYGESIYSG